MSSSEHEATAATASKRRRPIVQIEVSSTESDESSSADSPHSLHDGPDARAENEAKERQKPKHRIHIVQNPDLAQDAFFSQVPTSTEDPYLIRGAYWVKPKPVTRPTSNLSGTPALMPSRPSSRDECLNGEVRQQMAPPARPPRLRGHPQSPEPNEMSGDNDDMEVALIDELVDFDPDDLPADEDLLRAETEAFETASQEISSQDLIAMHEAPTRLVAPQNNLRQMTLFGAAVRDNGVATQSSQRVRNWPEANRNEPPTHHELDEEAMETWVYPTNLGTIRDYQFNIVSRGLYHNLLVALPTGLGKTFIAATIMLNWFRWTKDAQIVFVAPTRPLVAQQVDACFHIAGIPRSTTTLLTGQTSPALRNEEWQTKRVFFMTPQTIINDLKSGICDPKRIVLVVVDEAHRATGNYAYVEVVKFLRRFNTSFRVLALTATPGSTVESVQDVIDGLGIARTEIRTEESIDIRQYVHQRNIDTMLFDFSEETQLIMDLLSNAIRPVLNKLNSLNAYWSKDPMALSAYGCTIARQKWMNSPAGKAANWGTKGMVNSIFTVLAGIAHALELLKFHGIGPFYHKVKNPSDTDKKENKYEKQIREHADFRKMISTCRTWTNTPEFLGHPKLEYLSSVVLNHFIDAGEGRDNGPNATPSATRIMIFSHYRDSAEEIARVLDRHKPMVRPHVFVGQANTSASDGMDQKKQQDIIGKFRKGEYNTLVATSIGEEGLDIGEVDLIICYDASASPIRMLQRMGRTGRKRAGNIVVLLMKKKEQDNFEKAKDNYEKMQKMIADGVRFTYHDELSPRIVPKGTVPTVDKRIVEIPIENTQAELPEPKRKGKLPKRPPKKFHMPDGVITGFLSASNIDGRSTRQRSRSPTPDPVPDASTVSLSEMQTADLETRYLHISGDRSETVDNPRLDKFPALCRQLRPTKLVGHGVHTSKVVSMLRRMHTVTEDDAERIRINLHCDDQTLADRARRGEAAVALHMPSAPALDYGSEPEAPRSRKRKAPSAKAPVAKKQKKKSGPASAPIDSREDDIQAFIIDTDDEHSVERRAPAKRQAKAKTVKAAVRKRKKAPQPPPSPTQVPPSTDDAGIDIMNTDDDNDRNEDDDDDDGSDLLDFIDDGTQQEPAPSSSEPSRTQTPEAKKADKRRGRLKPAQLFSSQEDAELSDVIAPSRASRVSPVRRRAVRRVVDDSD